MPPAKRVGLRSSPCLGQYFCATCVPVMDDWDYLDDRQLQNWKGEQACITCQHFTYGVDGQCRTILGCKLRRGQLQRGEHLPKRCERWSTDYWLVQASVTTAQQQHYSL